MLRIWKNRTKKNDQRYFLFQFFFLEKNMWVVYQKMKILRFFNLVHMVRKKNLQKVVNHYSLYNAMLYHCSFRRSRTMNIGLSCFCANEKCIFLFFWYYLLVPYYAIFFHQTEITKNDALYFWKLFFVFT